MLTLSDYQKEALKTSDETNTLEYCVLGLVSEAGEVAGVVKKWLRGDYDEATMRAKMLDELGDVLWYVAVTDTRVPWWPESSSDLFDDFSFDEDETRVFMSSEDADISIPLPLAVRRMGRRIADVDRFAEEGDLDELWSALTGTVSYIVLCGRLCGVKFADIAAHNIAKLRDRQERGVIRGSGDER